MTQIKIKIPQNHPFETEEGYTVLFTKEEAEDFLMRCSLDFPLAWEFHEQRKYWHADGGELFGTFYIMGDDKAGWFSTAIQENGIVKRSKDVNEVKQKVQKLVNERLNAVKEKSNNNENENESEDSQCED